MSAGRHKWVECGKFGRPWGIKGQVTVFWTGGACPVKAGRGEVYTRDLNGDYVPHLVLAARDQGSRSVVSLEGVSDPNEAKTLTNKIVYIPEDVLPKLKKNEYYCYQIMGLKVETAAGRHIGEVIKIIPTGSNDVYEVKPPKGPTILIPAIKDVIVKIDIKNGKMIIEPMEGMLD